jgi:hypothetical protein
MSSISVSSRIFSGGEKDAFTIADVEDEDFFVALAVLSWQTGSWHMDEKSASRTGDRLGSVADVAVCHITAKPVLRPCGLGL